MKQFRILVFYFTLFNLSFFLNTDVVHSQCTGGAPSFTLNFTGKPDSVWTVTNVSRGGNCCSTSSCVEFVVTLDSMTSGIKLDLLSGSAALNYSIGCMGSYPMGANVCVSGVGPHRITFCKSGSNANDYRITCIKKSQASGTTILNQSCTGTLISTGYAENTITWNSVPNNATYNALLSCTSACDTVYITPSGTMPSNIKYRACGTLTNGCSSSTSCDTITVNFSTNSSVNISTPVPVMCYGQTTTRLTASGTGGFAPYTYSWSNGASTSYVDVGNGTYIVSMRDSANCMTSKDTFVVTSFNTPIIANAGSDTSICNQNSSISLSGGVILAGGGLWYGGMGGFSPSNSAFNISYTPTQQEKTSGQVTLYLMTNNNGYCTGDTDDVTIYFLPPPTVSLVADTLACSDQSYTYTTNTISGTSRKWTVTGGAVSGLDTGSSVNIIWGNTGAGSGTGTLNIKQTTNSNGCQSTVSKSIHVYDKPPVKPIQHR